MILAAETIINLPFTLIGIPKVAGSPLTQELTKNIILAVIPAKILIFIKDKPVDFAIETITGILVDNIPLIIKITAETIAYKGALAISAIKLANIFFPVISVLNNIGSGLATLNFFYDWYYYGNASIDTLICQDNGNLINCSKVAKIIISPENQTIRPSESISFEAKTYDKDNKQIDVPTDKLIWTASNNSVIGITGNGSKATVVGKVRGNSLVTIKEIQSNLTAATNVSVVDSSSEMRLEKDGGFEVSIVSTDCAASGNTLTLSSPVFQILTNDACKANSQTFKFPGPYKAGTIIKIYFYSGWIHSSGLIKQSGSYPDWELEMEDGTDMDFNDVVMHVKAY